MQLLSITLEVKSRAEEPLSLSLPSVEQTAVYSLNSCPRWKTTFL